MRLTIIGSHGTLGKPLCGELIQRGYEVHGVGLLHRQSSFPYTRADIADFSQIYAALKQQEPEVVYNLAAEFGRINGEKYTKQLWNTNAVGLKNLLHLQKEMGFKLIHASSSEIYGNGDLPLPLKEHYPNLYPLFHHNDYAMSKWVNEQQIRNFLYEEGPRDIVVLRFFNAYGPGEHYHPYRSVVCLFCYKSLAGESLTVFQNYHRVFMYITDFTPTLANVATTPLQSGEVINIGGTEYRNIEDVVEIIRKELGSTFRSEVKLLSQDSHNTVNKLPNIDKAAKLLGHEPKVTLEEGVPLTIQWMKEIYGK